MDVEVRVSKNLIGGGAAIAQWICLSHPSAPGLSPKHIIYAFFNLYCSNFIFVIWNVERINKKRPGLAH